jgi:hypothetical protein
VIDGWLKSPTHKDNVLHTEYTHIGIAIKACLINGTSMTIVVAHYANVTAPPSRIDGVVNGFILNKESGIGMLRNSYRVMSKLMAFKYVEVEPLSRL